ncbi:MAG TPA: CBS domain-containing protein [Gammaproteobacteria bacterium]|nr:CBS domain-containing protein [Gammaproteobacteria bacterium]
MSVGKLCSRVVTVVRREESIMAAARLMRQQHVGNVVVVDAEGDGQRPVGILTDRDIVVELVAKELDLKVVTVGDAMSCDLLTLPEDMDLLEAVGEMRSHAVRRAPVVDARGMLVGIISIDDVLGVLAELLKDLSCLVNKEQRREKVRRV